jgi:hypothetical protein
MLRPHTGEVCGDHLGTLHSAAAVRAPEGSLHRSDRNRRLCVCSVRAIVQEARIASACVCEEKECHRPGRPKRYPGDSVK